MLSTGTIGEAISRFVVVAVVIGFLALCKRFVATSKSDIENAESAEVRLPSMIAVNACMIVVAIAVALGLHSVLVAANRYLATRTQGIEMVLYPSSAIWWFLPGFASLCLTWEITYRVWSVFDLRRANAYRAYSNVKSGFDSTKVLRWMAILIVVPIAVATLLALPIHTTLTSTEIRDGHFATLTESVLPYSNASELIQFEGSESRDGSFYSRAGLLVRFRDGESWNSADTDDPKPQVDPALVRLLVQHTGLQLQQTHLQPN